MKERKKQKKDKNKRKIKTENRMKKKLFPLFLTLSFYFVLSFFSFLVFKKVYPADGIGISQTFFV